MNCQTIEYWINLLGNIFYYISDILFILFKSWPLAILIVLFWLKDSLNSLILRVNEVHVADKKIVLQPMSNSNGLLGQPPSTVEPTEVTKKKNIRLPKLPDNFIFKSVVEKQEKFISNTIKDTPFKKEDVLIRELASYQLAVDFERIYQFIFKSQIDAMEGLVNSSEGKSKQDIITYYENAKQQNTIAYEKFSFDTWLYYLTSQGLVEEKSSQYHITEKGQAFIYYITQQQRYNWMYKGL